MRSSFLCINVIRASSFGKDPIISGSNIKIGKTLLFSFKAKYKAVLSSTRKSRLNQNIVIEFLMVVKSINFQQKYIFFLLRKCTLH